MNRLSGAFILIAANKKQSLALLLGIRFLVRVQAESENAGINNAGSV